MNREELEKAALDTVSPELYYELHNTLEENSDEDLQRIISYGGDYAKEEAYQTLMEQE